MDQRIKIVIENGKATLSKQVYYDENLIETFSNEIEPLCEKLNLKNEISNRVAAIPTGCSYKYYVIVEFAL